MENDELKKILDELNNKIDNLYKVVEKGTDVVEKESTSRDKEEIKIEMILNNLSGKFDEILKSFKDKKENVEGKIKENPIAYVAGTFLGGIIVGYLIKKGKEEK